MIKKITQISVFIPNKIGELRKVTKVLSDEGINLEAISIAETADFGILRIIASDTDKALECLKKNNFTTKISDVLKVKMKDEAGALYNFLDKLNSENIEVEYIYSSAGESIFNIVKVKPEQIDTVIKIF